MKYPDDKKEFGSLMIWHGEWSEFFQKRENFFMFDYHNEIYQTMMKIYHKRWGK